MPEHGAAHRVPHHAVRDAAAMPRAGAAAGRRRRARRRARLVRGPCQRTSVAWRASPQTLFGAAAKRIQHPLLLYMQYNVVLSTLPGATPHDLTRSCLSLPAPARTTCAWGIGRMVCAVRTALQFHSHLGLRCRLSAVLLATTDHSRVGARAQGAPNQPAIRLTKQWPSRAP